MKELSPALIHDLRSVARTSSFLIGLCLLSSCGQLFKGPDSKSKPNGVPNAPVVYSKTDPNAAVDFKSLARQDLATLGQNSKAAFDTYDSGEGQGSFSGVFGGTDPSYLTRFFSARVGKVLTHEEFKQYKMITPLKYQAWLKSAPPPPDSESPQRGKDDGTEKKGEVQAVNYGVLVWLQSLAEGRPVELSNGDNTIRVDDPRKGFIVLYPGYRLYLDMGNNTHLRLPPQFRQETLLHEARHSDCTGGITEDDVTVIRNSQNNVEFDQDFKSRKCGHLHSACPKGSTFEGINACDANAWGPYAVGATFASAVAPSLTGKDQRVMLAVSADAWSRVYDGTEQTRAALKRGEHGKPDMSSTPEILRNRLD